MNKSQKINKIDFENELQKDIYIKMNQSNWFTSLNLLISNIKEYLEAKFENFAIKFNYSIQKRWKSVFKQYINRDINFNCVFRATIRLINESNFQISSIMDIIRIYEFVISYLTNISNTRNDNHLSRLSLNVEDVMYILFKNEGVPEIRALFLSNLKQAYFDLIAEYKNILTCNVYLFPDHFAAVYHYYKHKKFGKKLLTFFEYLKQAKYYIDIVVNNYNKVQIKRRNNYNIPYTIYFNAYEIEYDVKMRNKMGENLTYILEIYLYQENMSLKLVFDKSGNDITIKTFYFIELKQ